MFANEKVAEAHYSDREDMILENWSCQSIDDISNTKPEDIKMVFCGNVYNHKSIDDGTYVHTSTVKEINLKEGFIITRNSKYKLGKVDKEYLLWCIDHNVSDLEEVKKYDK